jgi:hypothetical protein
MNKVPYYKRDNYAGSHDTRHNDTQHSGLICDTQRNDTQNNDTQHNGRICNTQHVGLFATLGIHGIKLSIECYFDEYRYTEYGGTFSRCQKDSLYQIPTMMIEENR